MQNGKGRRMIKEIEKDIRIKKNCAKKTFIYYKDVLKETVKDESIKQSIVI